MSTSSPVALAEVQHIPTRRHTIGLDGIDWVYGSSPCPNEGLAWGLPAGSVSLWAGAAGCGKSRLAVALTARMSLRGCSILFAQNEVNLPQLKSWFSSQSHDARQIAVLDRPCLDELLQGLQTLRPALVVVDSVSMIEGIERQATAKRAMAALCSAAERAGSHIVLIGHLNSRGQVKGGTTLPHLVDTVAVLEPGDLRGWVRFGIDSKHRFGPTGRYAMLVHDKDGLRVFFVGDEQFPMMTVRFDAATGQVIRRVPLPGTGGKQIEIDDAGRSIQPHRRQSILRRLLG